jgi:hypothetical protein
MYNDDDSFCSDSQDGSELLTESCHDAFSIPGNDFSKVLKTRQIKKKISYELKVSIIRRRV